MRYRDGTANIQLGLPCLEDTNLLERVHKTKAEMPVAGKTQGRSRVNRQIVKAVVIQTGFFGDGNPHEISIYAYSHIL